MNLLLKMLLLLFSSGLLEACKSPEKKPNIILIMADDMGYECLSVNGATEYHTPNLDRLAENGLRFTNTFSQPLCTPSRVKIMTGKYNYHNYEYFGYLNPDQKTFGNLMQEAGYKTCISGKWQLNGITFERQGFEDTDRPNHFGFDAYCLWQLNRPRKDGERYATPLITQNGRELTGQEDNYGPDVFSDFICDFIDINHKSPFFIYYPMVLVHEPFVPTPDSEAWADFKRRYEKDTSYFKDMLSYTDKIVGKIEQKLIEKGIAENTLLIFTADNGTDTHIVTQTVDGQYPGGKSFTTQRGIHVPMIVSWPGQLGNSGIYSGIIDFGDFYPTLAEIANQNISKEQMDGQSFLGALMTKSSISKSSTMIHYDPEWGNASKKRNRFAMNEQYKLYQNGELFDYRSDIDEQKPLSDLTEEQLRIKNELEKLLVKAEKEAPWKK